MPIMTYSNVEIASKQIQKYAFRHFPKKKKKNCNSLNTFRQTFHRLFSLWKTNLAKMEEFSKQKRGLNGGIFQINFK